MATANPSRTYIPDFIVLVDDGHGDRKDRRQRGGNRSHGRGLTPAEPGEEEHETYPSRRPGRGAQEIVGLAGLAADDESDDEDEGKADDPGPEHDRGGGGTSSPLATEEVGSPIED